MKTSLHGLLLALLLTAAPIAATTGCGRTPGDAPTSAGGRQSPGGTSETGGSKGQGGSVTAGGSKGQAGSVASGGSKGRGGSVGAGGSGGSRTGGSSTSVTPRTPAIHRATATSCVGVNAPPEPNPSYRSPSSSCASHADCTAGTNGKCVNGIGAAYAFYYCVYDQCGSDADCDPGKICYCNETTSARCLSVGNCRTDADCGNTDYGYCSPSMGFDCGGYHTIDSYHCHTPADACIDNSDCKGTDFCDFDDLTGRWKCTPINSTCVIG